MIGTDGTSLMVIIAKNNNSAAMSLSKQPDLVTQVHRWKTLIHIIDMIDIIHIPCCKKFHVRTPFLLYHCAEGKCDLLMNEWLLEQNATTVCMQHCSKQKRLVYRRILLWRSYMVQFCTKTIVPPSNWSQEGLWIILSNWVKSSG